MVDYWTSFARSGAPQAAGQAAWRPYGSGRALMHIADVPRAEQHLMPGMYEHHEQVMCRRRVCDRARDNASNVRREVERHDSGAATLWPLDSPR